MNKAYKIIWLIIILLLITVPVLGLRTFDNEDINFIRLFEKREPNFVKDFVSQGKINREAIEGYFNERMLLRRKIIEGYVKINLGLGVERGPYANIVVGKDGWLFEANEVSLDQRTTHNQNKLGDAHTVKQIKYIDEELKKRDVDIVYMIRPFKADVYPEFLPNYYTANKKVDYFASVIEGMAPEYSSRLMNMPVVLEKNKEEYGADLFYKTDGHWTEAGAYLAYMEFVVKLNEQGNDYSYYDSETYRRVDFDTMLDLGFLLGTGVKEKTFVDINLTDRKYVEAIYLTDEQHHVALQRYENSEALNDATVLIVGNSYFDDPGKEYQDSPKQLFTNTFSHVVYFHLNNLANGENESDILQKLITYYDVDAVLMQYFNYIDKWQFVDEALNYDIFTSDFYLMPAERMVKEKYSKMEFVDGKLNIIPLGGQAIMNFNKCDLKSGENNGYIKFTDGKKLNVTLAFYSDDGVMLPELTQNFEDISSTKFNINLSHDISHMRLTIDGEPDGYEIEKFWITRRNDESAD